MLNGQELTRDGKVIMSLEKKNPWNSIWPNVYLAENPEISRNSIVGYSSNLSFYGQIDRILKNFESDHRAPGHLQKRKL